MFSAERKKLYNQNISSPIVFLDSRNQQRLSLAAELVCVYTSQHLRGYIIVENTQPRGTCGGMKAGTWGGGESTGQGQIGGLKTLAERHELLQDCRTPTAQTCIHTEKGSSFSAIDETLGGFFFPCTLPINCVIERCCQMFLSNAVPSCSDQMDRLIDSVCVVHTMSFAVLCILEENQNSFAASIIKTKQRDSPPLHPPTRCQK